MYDNANRITKDHLNQMYTQDLDGNLATKQGTGGTTTYCFDAENQLTKVILPGAGGTITYRYDGLGRRIEKNEPGTITRYIYDYNNIWDTYDANTPQPNLKDRVIHGLGIDELMRLDRSGQSYFYLVDGLESVVKLVNTNGVVQQSYVYDSFGNIVSQPGTVNQPFTYTGREWDAAAGLYYYRARYYAPTIGQFISEDLLRNFGGISLYVYVGDNPVSFIDPFGLHKIFYDGKDVRLFDDDGKLLIKCRATSGRPGSTPRDQDRPDYGPIPRGSYWFDPTEFANPSMFDYRDWGTWKVPLYPTYDTNTYGRRGFALHGGKIPGSAGCIDTGPCDERIHDALKNHRGIVRVDVRYTNWEPF